MNNASLNNLPSASTSRVRSLLLIAIFVLLAGGIGLAVLMQIQAYESHQVYLATEAALPRHRSSKSADQLINESARQYAGKDFSFNYPSKLSLLENNGKVILTHSIPYKNHGTCDMVGEDKTYPNLEDLNLQLWLEAGTLASVVRKNSPYIPRENFSLDTLKISPGFIDSYQIGPLSGFAIYEGAEGCGQNTYYFPVDANRVLVAQNAMVQQLSGIFSDMREKEILAIPGAISRQENKEILDFIIKSFRLNQPGSASSDSWKIYRNEEYGFELGLPKYWSNSGQNILPDGTVFFYFSGKSSEEFFVIKVRQYPESLDYLTKNFTEGKIIKVSEIIIDKKPSVEIFFSSGVLNLNKAYCIYNQKLYSFDIDTMKYLGVFETFKFIK